MRMRSYAESPQRFEPNFNRDSMKSSPGGRAHACVEPINAAVQADERKGSMAITSVDCRIVE